MGGHDFDPGYGQEPFRSLCADYPGEEVYPAADFRVEWGPVFHRGRLDGSARVVVIGQDPAQHEAITRRILVGAAGQRLQGFLAKLGIEVGYVMVNAFLYSVYGQGGGERHADDPAIAAYRNRWLDALLVDTGVEAVVALGRLADRAFRAWKVTPAGQGVEVAYQRITHPTAPESSARGDEAAYERAVEAMLRNWNQALERLRPAIRSPDVDRDLVLYGTALQPTDYAVIPERDLPAGLPAWMRSRSWADRVGRTRDLKRATIAVVVPRGQGLRGRLSVYGSGKALGTGPTRKLDLTRPNRRSSRRPQLDAAAGDTPYPEYPSRYNVVNSAVAHSGEQRDLALTGRKLEYSGQGPVGHTVMTTFARACPSPR